jgi:hypothetical protein
MPSAVIRNLCHNPQEEPTDHPDTRAQHIWGNALLLLYPASPIPVVPLNRRAVG